MKRTLCLLLALILALSLTACGKEDGSEDIRNDSVNTPRGNRVGDLCYSVALTRISENGVALSTFDPTALGKITVINF